MPRTSLATVLAASLLLSPFGLAEPAEPDTPAALVARVETALAKDDFGALAGTVAPASRAELASSLLLMGTLMAEAPEKTGTLATFPQEWQELLTTHQLKDLPAGVVEAVMADDPKGREALASHVADADATQLLNDLLAALKRGMTREEWNAADGPVATFRGLKVADAAKDHPTVRRADGVEMKLELVVGRYYLGAPEK